ncbi:hypothetical protein, partial [Corynebacterium variabile]|uniref:hypothetical protein n=1 Tax=Corynebacterium variabile TaxID=1727 RepID=UPI003735A951
TGLATGLTACGSGDDDTGQDAGQDAADGTPHGYVDGAEEATEPQLRLAVSDADAGTLTLVDLLTGDTVQTEDAAELHGSDNRYLFTTGEDTTTVTDSGVWTVDHGDHFHYYRSEPGTVGEVPAGKPGHVMSADTRVAFFDDASGDVKVYPRADLDDDVLEPVTEFSVGAHHGVAVPFANQVVSTLAPAAEDAELPDTLAVIDEAGEKSDLAGDATCTDIHGAATVRDAALFACADGVLTVTQEDASDTLTGTLIPYPEDAGGRAWSLAAGRDLVGVPFEDGGLGLLDPESGTWAVAPTDAPVTSATVSPDDGSVLALDEDGTGYAVDPETGDILADSALVDSADSADSASVVLGTERGYVSDPASGTVTELDVADGLRETREFDLGGAPGALAVTGGK